MAEKEPVQIVLPEGRVINQSLNERDIFVDAKGREAKPSYKIEVALDWDDLDDLYDAMAEVAQRDFGDDAVYTDDDGNLCLADSIRSPIKDGDDLAKAREQKGKQGDAYKGFAVVRASTQFNKNGEDAGGGVYVADPDGEEMDFELRSKSLYNGMYGKAAISVDTYDIDGRGVKLYLRGFQFTRDGEPLRSNSVAAAFKPLAQSSGGKGRAKRS